MPLLTCHSTYKFNSNNTLFSLGTKKSNDDKTRMKGESPPRKSCLAVDHVAHAASMRSRANSRDITILDVNKQEAVIRSDQVVGTRPLIISTTPPPFVIVSPSTTYSPPTITGLSLDICYLEFLFWLQAFLKTFAFYITTKHHDTGRAGP